MSFIALSNQLRIQFFESIFGLFILNCLNQCTVGFLFALSIRSISVEFAFLISVQVHLPIFLSFSQIKMTWVFILGDWIVDFIRLMWSIEFG